MAANMSSARQPLVAQRSAWTAKWATRIHVIGAANAHRRPGRAGRARSPCRGAPCAARAAVARPPGVARCPPDPCVACVHQRLPSPRTRPADVHRRRPRRSAGGADSSEWKRATEPGSAAREARRSAPRQRHGDQPSAATPHEQMLPGPRSTRSATHRRRNPPCAPTPDHILAGIAPRVQDQRQQQRRCQEQQAAREPSKRLPRQAAGRDDHRRGQRREPTGSPSGDVATPRGAHCRATIPPDPPPPRHHQCPLVPAAPAARRRRPPVRSRPAQRTRHPIAGPRAGRQRIVRTQPRGSRRQMPPTLPPPASARRLPAISSGLPYGSDGTRTRDLRRDRPGKDR